MRRKIGPSYFLRVAQTQMNIQVPARLREDMKSKARQLSTPTFKLTTKAMVFNLMNWFMKQKPSEQAKIAYGDNPIKTTK